MTLNNGEYITTKEAATLVGVSVPTILRVAGSKVGLDGEVFPKPEQVSKKNFAWSLSTITRWVEVNGKAPPTNRGRPKGSTRRRSFEQEYPAQGRPEGVFEQPLYR